jgi:uncharacterized protein GlcG (DUF336 family)
MNSRVAAIWRVRQRLRGGPTKKAAGASTSACGPFALAKARESNWQMAISIVDPAGVLVYFERIDGTQNGSSNVATEKARSAALFKRPTKAFQDALAAGGEGLRILHIPGAVAIDGGLPIVMGGRIVGAIGVSGGTSAQDGVVALAGVGAVR